MCTVEDTPSRLKILFPSKTIAFREMRISKHQSNLHMPVNLCTLSPSLDMIL